ncbi:DUF1998 domain-containing protein [Acidianus sulfidivorans JP7]|uniref:MrfA-like Zn-binding domain-containing protein n=1 Tax=Acidianus sulfidivorans JP7 TaxID=619593 RepID=A0A2U9IQ86_9CREN|nr:DUF1998 domain-containing protein [Acidianus sulfidivorans]AWR98137.1 DUF1998 domain-containing protein [Acidianus sulfidivorans JP7]
MQFPNVYHIRGSQFVFFNGPGSIIETAYGPRLIPALNTGLRGRLQIIKKYEIEDTRLQKFLKLYLAKLGYLKENNVRIFSLPTNASEKIPATSPLYSTAEFPREWRLCTKSHNSNSHLHILFKAIDSKNCPVCKNSETSPAPFVAICNNGHLDEVNFDWLMHQGKKCKTNYYYFEVTGSSPLDAKIKCPSCDVEKNVDEIIKMKTKCTGRLPEKEPLSKISHGKHKENCDEEMSIVRRRSLAVYQPEILVLLTLPKYDRPIVKVLMNSTVKTTIDTWRVMLGNSEYNDEAAKKLLSSLRKNVKQEYVNEIEKFINGGINELLTIYDSLYNPQQTESLYDFIFEEFEALINKNNTENFKMLDPKIVPQQDKIPSLLVYPIEVLRTVTVQIGYKRIAYHYGEPKMQPIGEDIYSDGTLWFPGFENKGEGIFITFNGNPPDLSKYHAYSLWESEESTKQKWPQMEKNPQLFTWLHTLSHSLITTISLYAGYSSASIRERIYVNKDGNKGGILIYTTSFGTDGSLGGLIETVNNFDKILDQAIRRIKICSNDPLCKEIQKTNDRKNGAACYSCLFISETSCEYNNTFLDRHMILGD